MSPRSLFGRWAACILVGLVTGGAVFAIALGSAWNGYRNVYPRSEHGKTKQELELLAAEIENHKKATGSWPARLTDLKGLKEKGILLDEANRPLDWWWQPLQYRVEDGGYVLYSYGRDRAPGGGGQQTDLYAGQADPEVEQPTFWQFVALPEALPILLACGLAGVTTLVVCLIQAKGETGQPPPSLLKVVAANLVTGVLALLAAMVLAALHYVPGGH